MKMKKFAALAAATVMSVSAIAATSAFGVFATTDAGVNNIVIKDSDTNRVYKAYQIFDQASATNTIKWGKGINGDALLTSLKTSGLSTYMSQFDSAENAVDVAKIISDADHWTKEDTAKFAKAASACIIDNKSVTAYEDNGEYTIPLPNAGYYLVVDATENNGVDKAQLLSLTFQAQQTLLQRGQSQHLQSRSSIMRITHGAMLVTTQLVTM